MTNLLYPRVIEIHRSKLNTATVSTGILGYSGREQSTVSTDPEGEVVLYTNIPANIVAKTSGRIKGAELPGDYTDRPQWQIIIPASALPEYAVRDRDIVVDDEGYRYGISQNYWTIAGYALTCVRLEA